MMTILLTIFLSGDWESDDQLHLLPHCWARAVIPFSQTPQDISKDRVLIKACEVISLCLLSLSGSGGGAGQSLELLILETLRSCTGPARGLG